VKVTAEMLPVFITGDLRRWTQGTVPLIYCCIYIM